jgi:hypothetical protein
MGDSLWYACFRVLRFQDIKVSKFWGFKGFEDLRLSGVDFFKGF